MPDIYTKEMRINHEACPICGFWHTALSCPPQVAVTIKYLHERLTSALAKVTQLEAEVEDLNKEKQRLIQAMQELRECHKDMYTRDLIDDVVQNVRGVKDENTL